MSDDRDPIFQSLDVLFQAGRDHARRGNLELVGAPAVFETGYFQEINESLRAIGLASSSPCLRRPNFEFRLLCAFADVIPTEAPLGFRYFSDQLHLRAWKRVSLVFKEKKTPSAKTLYQAWMGGEGIFYKLPPEDKEAWKRVAEEGSRG